MKLTAEHKDSAKHVLFGIVAAFGLIFVYNVLSGRNTAQQGRESVRGWFLPGV